MATYRILSLDGGGIRGVLTADILVRLQEQVPGLIDNADLIAGTSTGGILALALAFGKSPTELRDLYFNRCKDIFDDSFLDNVFDLGRLTGAQYGNRKLRNMVRSVVGDAQLKDLKKKVLISSFDLDNEHPVPSKRTWKPKFFHNMDGDDNDGEETAYKVALYTSAAPTYFPSVDGFVDGGVIANNPSMAALLQTQDKRAVIKDRPTLDEVILLSVGTGKPRFYIKGARNDWGYAQWAKPILNVMFDGGMSLVEYQCRQLLGNNYHRISPVLEQAIDVDSCDLVQELVNVGESMSLGESVRWLKNNWG
jgi:patatin-like phospholipase/acyl hydrolase